MKILTSILLFTAVTMNAQNIKVTSGKIERFENFKSQYVNSRNIDVWLPNGYSANEKYAVLYMHDGQMLFDSSLSWNGNVWEVDETAGKLLSENKVQKFIVVAIWNNGLKRHGEYFPQKAYEKLTAEQKQFVSDNLLSLKIIDKPFAPNSDNYLKFLVTELKPFIDKTFATKTDALHTFIAGSSMGGLISVYAVCEYPEVFGGAACLSTHWTGIYQLDDNPIPDTFYAYLKQHLPNPKNHKIYFDYGDKTLDALYPGLQQKVDVIMKKEGFTAKNRMTKFFPGKDHSESAWRERFVIPLEFLLKK
jgi:enterochelin esterase-like enzyme